MATYIKLPGGRIKRTGASFNHRANMDASLMRSNARKRFSKAYKISFRMGAHHILRAPQAERRLMRSMWRQFTANPQMLEEAFWVRCAKEVKQK